MSGNDVATGENAAGPERDLYPVPEAAERIGISERQVWRLIAAGEIDVHKVGTRTLISPETIADLKRRTLVPAVATADQAVA